jgi:hypothetical protein
MATQSFLLARLDDIVETADVVDDLLEALAVETKVNDGTLYAENVKDWSDIVKSAESAIDKLRALATAVKSAVTGKPKLFARG